jgi:hypothetical protein
MVAQIYNPSCLGGRDQKYRGSSTRKIFHLNQYLGVVVSTCHLQLDGEAQMGRLLSSLAENKARPYLKNEQHTKDWWSGSNK